MKSHYPILLIILLLLSIVVVAYFSIIEGYSEKQLLSLNYILWGLLAAIKDYAIFPSRFSRLTHWAAALAYSEYKASFGNDENEPRHIARGRLGFTLVGMRYYHTGKIDIDDSLCIDLCRVNKDNVYQGKLTAHVRVGFFSNQTIPVTSD